MSIALQFLERIAEFRRAGLPIPVVSDSKYAPPEFILRQMAHSHIFDVSAITDAINDVAKSILIKGPPIYVPREAIIFPYPCLLIEGLGKILLIADTLAGHSDAKHVCYIDQHTTNLGDTGFRIQGKYTLIAPKGDDYTAAFPPDFEARWAFHVELFVAAISVLLLIAPRASAHTVVRSAAYPRQQRKRLEREGVLISGINTVSLRYDERDEEHGGGAAAPGRTAATERCLHFVRSHFRFLPTGRITKVRAHTRGVGTSAPRQVYTPVDARKGIP